MEIDFGGFGRAADRSGGAIVRGRGERDMAFAGKQPGGRIEPDPASARQVNLGPGMKIGEIGFRTLGPLARGHIGDHLDEIA